MILVGKLGWAAGQPANLLSLLLAAGFLLLLFSRGRRGRALIGLAALGFSCLRLLRLALPCCSYSNGGFRGPPHRRPGSTGSSCSEAPSISAFAVLRGDNVQQLGRPSARRNGARAPSSRGEIGAERRRGQPLPGRVSRGARDARLLSSTKGLFATASFLRSARVAPMRMLYSPGRSFSQNRVKSEF
jgi:hypothetical protein